MGGYVIGRSLEQYPGYYDGALPMCGVLGDQTLFDFFLDYNLVAQALAGVPAYPMPADYLTNAVPRIQVALGLAGLTPAGPDTTNDLGKQLRAITVNRSGGPRPGADAAFAVWKDFLFSHRAPHRPRGDSPAAAARSARHQPVHPLRPQHARSTSTRTVQRVAPENLRSGSPPTLTQVPRIDGRPTAPVLSLHGLGDLFVPFSHGAGVRRRRGPARPRQAGRAAGHPDHAALRVQPGRGRRRLGRPGRLGTHRASARPATRVTDPAVVAAPDFGCRFSDRAAYAAGAGTRRLYPAC